MSKNIFWILSACVFLTCGLSSRASLIYSTLPEDNTFDLVYCLAIGGTGSSWNGQEYAAAFTVPDVPELTIDTVDLILESVSSSALVNVTILADNSGIPGTALTTTQVTAPAESLVTADFSEAPVLLTAGNRYWLYLSAAEPTGRFFWNYSSPAIKGSLAYHSNTAPAWNISNNVTLPAFRITSVPEPTTILLLGLGGLVLRKRNR